tara:strand:- start:68 stop:370 length:303 start_codon:yes stop_codon:yes gene_type:complete
MLSKWIVADKHSEPNKVFESIFEKNLCNNKTVARILRERSPYFMGAYNESEYSVGFICSKIGESFSEAIFVVYDKDIDIIKFKIDVKLSELGYKIKKLGV